ncbi:effector-associated constant component EACC1 [Actinoplanes sp. CA-054009]
MQLTVDAGADELQLLREFLESDVNVRRGGDLRPGRATDPEHQGIDIQALSLAITSTLSVANLLLQVANWRRTRPQRPIVTITQERPDGVVVRIDTFDESALSEALRKLENG